MNTLFDLTGKRIVITGAAGHIGRTLAKALNENGARVWGVDRADLSDDLASVLEGYIQVELGDQNALETALAEHLNAMKEVHGFVHCAAFVGTSNLSGWLGDFFEQSRETFDQAMQVNIGSAFTLVQKLAPVFKSPSLVFMSSIYGEAAPDFSLYEGTSMDNPIAYGASKSALQQFSKYIASRHGEMGWRCNSILLGGVFRGQPETFVERYVQRTALKRMATEADLIGPVTFLLSEASAYVTGAELAVDGGFLAV